MYAPTEVRHHSPALWWLAATGVAAGVILIGTGVWNVVDRWPEIREWLRL